MTFNYAKTAATALRLLTRFGADVTLRNVPSTGTYTPGGTNVPGGPTDVTRKGAIFDFGKGQVNAAGGLIQGGDKRLLMEVGVVPSLEDRVVANGVEYVIKGVGEVNPAGVPVVYDLHVRAA